MKKIIFILVMALIASPSLSQSKGEMPFTTTSPEANKLLRQAMAAYADVKLEEGAALSKEAIAKDPSFAMAHVFSFTSDLDQRKQNVARAESLNMSADEKLFVAGIKANNENKPTSEFFGPVLAKYP